MLRILNDTTCDLPQKIIDQYQLPQIPNGIVIDGASYNEYWDIKPDEFFQRQRTAKTPPTTAMVNMEWVEKLYREIIEKEEEALHITISSKMSGAYGACNIMLSQLEEEYGKKSKITVFDSYSISAEMGLMVAEACRLAGQGKTVEEIVPKIVEVRENATTMFVVNTLDYLIKGGRLNPAVGVLGALLNVKPIVGIRNGMVDQMAKEIGTKKAINKVVSTLEKKRQGKKLRVCFARGEAPKEYEILKALVIEKCAPDDIWETRLGSAVGAHTGPEIFGVFAAPYEE